MKLQDIQKQFLDCIYRDDDLLKSSFNNRYPDLSLNIYKNNAIHNLVSALSIMYPSVYNQLGEDAFNKVSKDYIKDNPSRDGNLDVYGINFPEFLRYHKNIKGYIYNLAQLDLAYHAVYVAVDYSIRPIDDFKNIASNDYTNLIFLVNPTLQLLELENDVLHIWKHQTKDVPVRRNNYVAMYRDSKVRVCAILIDEIEYFFIKQSVDNIKFYQIFCDIEEKFPGNDISNIINKLVLNNIIIDYDITK